MNNVYQKAFSVFSLTNLSVQKNKTCKTDKKAKIYFVTAPKSVHNIIVKT